MPSRFKCNVGRASYSLEDYEVIYITLLQIICGYAGNLNAGNTALGVIYFNVRQKTHFFSRFGTKILISSHEKRRFGNDHVVNLNGDNGLFYRYKHLASSDSGCLRYWTVLSAFSSITEVQTNFS